MDNSSPFLFPCDTPTYLYTSHFSDLLFHHVPYVFEAFWKKKKRVVLGSGKAVGDFCGQLQHTQILRGAEMKERAHR